MIIYIMNYLFIKTITEHQNQIIMKMTKIYILSLIFFFSGIVRSQVGISTSSPQGTWHVDGAKDNPATGAPSASQAANDVIITSTGNMGVGIMAPTNKLHVNGTNPLRLEGLQVSADTSGSLTVNSTGVVQLQNSSSISAVRATGNVSITVNNTFTTIGTPTETFDNLNELTGTTFTAATTGLYKVDFSINYPQRANTEDGGDGYLTFVTINLNGTAYSSKMTKVAPPEVSGAPSTITGSNSELIKMTTGNTLTFQGLTFGSNPTTAAPINGSYVVNIVRID